MTHLQACIVLLIMGVGHGVLANSTYIPPTLPNDLPCNVVRELTETQLPKEGMEIRIYRISIDVLTEGKKTRIALGPLTITKTRKERPYGIVVDSIRVHRLTEGPELWHIEWLDYMAGNGCYENVYYRVCRAGKPEQVIVSGTVPLRGRWGMGTGQSGEYQVGYSKGVLMVRETTTRIDTSHTWAHLYHRVPADKGDFFQMHKTMRLTRRIKIENDKQRRIGTTLEYCTQAQDALEEILAGLKVEKKWLTDTEKPLTPRTWLIFNIPDEVAEKRWPLIPEK